MGTTLTGTTPQDTYDSLIKVTDNGPLTGSLKKLTDGLGNDSSLSLSTTAASLSGTLAVTGNVTIDTSTLVVDAANNRVGINKATPTSDLDVSGTFAASSSVTAASLSLINTDGLFANFNSSNANGGYFTWQTSSSTIADIGTAQQIFGSGGNDTFGINARGARSLVFGSNNAERVRITSGGRVGIGTTATSTAGVPLLQVNGSVSKETQDGVIANAATITLFTLANNGVFLVTTKQNDDVNSRSTTCLIFTESSGTTTRQVDLATGTLWAVSMSGLSVQLTNTSLQNRAYSASVLQLF
jgi:hypothetical protein